MAEGAGEVDGRYKILDTRQKIKDGSLENRIYDFRVEYYKLSIINYPFQLFIIHQLLHIHNFFFFTK